MNFVRMLPRRLLRIGRSTTATVPSRRWYEKTFPRTAAAGAAGATLGTAIAIRLGKQIGDDGGEQHADVWPPLSHDEELARALPDDHPDTVQVRRVASDLIAAARDDEVFGNKRRLSERTGCRVDPRDAEKWKVHVIDHGEPYAFCYDSHDEIVVTTALLDELSRKDAFLATVLAREVTHMMAWHGIKMLPRYLLASVFSNYVGELLETPPDDEISRDDWLFLFMVPHFSRFLRRRPAAARPWLPPPPPPPLLPPSQAPQAPSLRRPDFVPSGRGFLRPTPPQAPPSRHFYTAPQRQKVIHFNRRRGSRWYHDQRKLTAVVFVTGGAAVFVYFGNLESVPYTNRTHFIILSPPLERQLGESQFASLKKELAPKILPPLHPESIRVRLIASEIVRAVHRGLAGPHRDAFAADDASYGDISTDLVIKSHEADAEEAMLGRSRGEDAGVAAAAAQRDEEVLDDRWITESRSRGKARGAQPETRHLDRLNWEVIVVRDDLVNAMCLPGGKIVVFTGLLDHFKTDAEIATVLAHELVILQFIYMPDLINAMSTLLLRLPFSRRMEIEADHIGLLLLGAAGYDPRIAPSVYEKLGKIGGDSALSNYLSTHPSSKKRAELLRQAKVMDEALALYKGSGQGTEGFL
uniref:Peptidase M48 domain-containing protein n=1 Tax=Leersia perrieri TaxID=77586 RepID=A0A0D9VKQ1_9ORYZ